MRGPVRVALRVQHGGEVGERVGVAGVDGGLVPAAGRVEVASVVGEVAKSGHRYVVAAVCRLLVPALRGVQVTGVLGEQCQVVHTARVAALGGAQVPGACAVVVTEPVQDDAEVVHRLVMPRLGGTVQRHLRGRQPLGRVRGYSDGKACGRVGVRGKVKPCGLDRRFRWAGGLVLDQDVGDGVAIDLPDPAACGPQRWADPANRSAGPSDGAGEPVRAGGGTLCPGHVDLLGQPTQQIGRDRLGVPAAAGVHGGGQQFPAQRRARLVQPLDQVRAAASTAANPRSVR